MLIKDELLRNSKNLWASILLCFSFTRNVRLLFLRHAPKNEHVAHKNVLYCVVVLGNIWAMAYNAAEMAFSTYPSNYESLQQQMTSFTYAIIYGGQLFGINMLFFGIGYIFVFRYIRYRNL